MSDPIFGSKAGELIVNKESGEGQVILSDEVLCWTNLLTADVIGDWIGILQNAYDAAVEGLHVVD